MITVLLIVHLFVTLALIGVVLIQRSEGGGLGIGSSQGMGSFMSGRGTANLLTRATAVLATVFLLLSLGLAMLNRGTGGVGHDLLDTAGAPRQAAPLGIATTPADRAVAPAASPVSGPTTRPPGDSGGPEPVVEPAAPGVAPAAPATAAPIRGPQVPTR